MKRRQALRAVAAGLAMMPVLLRPGPAAADNCSDPPKRRPDGTMSPPGPDCEGTAGFKAGKTGGVQTTATGAAVLTGTAAGWLLWQRGQLVRGPGGKWQVKPGSALEAYIRSRRQILEARGAGRPVTPEMVDAFKRALRGMRGEIPGFEKFGRNAEGLIGIRIAPGQDVGPLMTGYGEGSAPGPEHPQPATPPVVPATPAAGSGTTTSTTPPPDSATTEASGAQGGTPPPSDQGAQGGTSTPPPSDQGAQGGTPAEPPVPPELQPLVQGGDVTVDPAQWAPGGRVKEALLKQAPEVKSAVLDTSGGKIKVTVTAEVDAPILGKIEATASVELVVENGKIVAKATGDDLVASLAVAEAQKALDAANGPNAWLTNHGLTLDALEATPNGQIHIKTIKR